MRKRSRSQSSYIAWSGSVIGSLRTDYNVIGKIGISACKTGPRCLYSRIIHLLDFKMGIRSHWDSEVSEFVRRKKF